MSLTRFYGFPNPNLGEMRQESNEEEYTINVDTTNSDHADALFTPAASEDAD